MATSRLPEELVEEILLRLPPEEPEHMVSGALVCKAWRRILADDGFLRRYRRFHRTPPLLGFIYNHYFGPTTFEFVPTNCVAASTISMPTQEIHYTALDCRHGRVLLLIQSMERSSLVGRLIVWDPITGGQQQLEMPSYLHSTYSHTAAVLCAIDGCDHLNCNGGPFLVVLMGMGNHNDGGIHTWANVYSSETSAWRGWTPDDIPNQFVDETKPSLLVGKTLYFSTIFPGNSIVKYDFCKHELSAMDSPTEGRHPILIKGDDGGLAVADILHNCFTMWSWQVNIKGLGEWVKDMAMELEDTLLPNHGQPRNLICLAKSTNTVFIGMEHTEIFMLDLKSKQVRKLGKRMTNGLILPYTSFYTLKY